MYPSTSLNRFRRLVLVAGIVAGVAVPTAGAVTRPPDVQDSASALHSTVQGLKADGLRLQAVAQAYQQAQPAAPDVFERYASAHPFGTGLSSTESGVTRPPDVQDAASGSSVAVPDVIERYATAHPYGSGLSETSSVSRPPDVADAALAAQYGTPIQSSSDFSWGDWAIGIGSGVGLALLFGAGLVTGRQVRQRVRTA